MQRIIKVTLVAITLAFAAPLAAGPFEDGLDAYGRGDFAAALKEYRIAAVQGHVRAQNNLGYMYRFGQGVAQDHGEALKWYRKAAAKNHAQAEVMLGIMYRRGQGVAQDDAEAAKWWLKAADQGHALAQFSLGNMYFLGLGVAQDVVQSHMWWSLAADQGNLNATKVRYIVEGRMSPAQIAEAEKLAREWKPK